MKNNRTEFVNFSDIGIFFAKIKKFIKKVFNKYIFKMNAPVNCVCVKQFFAKFSRNIKLFLEPRIVLIWKTQMLHILWQNIYVHWIYSVFFSVTSDSPLTFHNIFKNIYIGRFTVYLIIWFTENKVFSKSFMWNKKIFP